MRNFVKVITKTSSVMDPGVLSSRFVRTSLESSFLLLHLSCASDDVPTPCLAETWVLLPGCKDVEASWVDGCSVRGFDVM